jgi:hypothetical protein
MLVVRLMLTARGAGPRFEQAVRGQDSHLKAAYGGCVLLASVRPLFKNWLWGMICDEQQWACLVSLKKTV